MIADDGQTEDLANTAAITTLAVVVQCLFATVVAQSVDPDATLAKVGETLRATLRDAARHRNDEYEVAKLDAEMQAFLGQTLNNVATIISRPPPGLSGENDAAAFH